MDWSKLQFTTWTVSQGTQAPMYRVDKLNRDILY